MNLCVSMISVSERMFAQCQFLIFAFLHIFVRMLLKHCDAQGLYLSHGLQSLEDSDVKLNYVCLNKKQVFAW